MRDSLSVWGSFERKAENSNRGEINGVQKAHCSWSGSSDLLYQLVHLARFPAASFFRLLLFSSWIIRQLRAALGRGNPPCQWPWRCLLSPWSPASETHAMAGGLNGHWAAFLISSCNVIHIVSFTFFSFLNTILRIDWLSESVFVPLSVNKIPVRFSPFWPAAKYRALRERPFIVLSQLYFLSPSPPFHSLFLSFTFFLFSLFHYPSPHYVSTGKKCGAKDEGKKLRMQEINFSSGSFLLLNFRKGKKWKCIFSHFRVFKMHWPTFSSQIAASSKNYMGR